MKRHALACLLAPLRRKKSRTIRNLNLESLEARDNPVPIPSVLGLGSSNLLLGEQANFAFTFQNTGTLPGFAPFIEVALDTSGPDGAATNPLDGYGTPTVTGAGLTLTSAKTIVLDGVQTTYTNPLTNESRPVPAGFGKNDTIYVYALPFGSFSPTQSTAVTITAPTSKFADVNSKLPIAVSGGFRDNEAALNGPGIYTGPATAGVTPELYRFRKVYLGPESETATGPNFIRRYRLEVDIADGQTLKGLQINDDLANSMQIAGINATNMAAFTTGGNIFSAGNLSGTAVPTTPDGTLSYSFGTVAGTAAAVDAAFEFDFYIPRDRAGGGQVVPQTATTGTDSTTNLNTGSTTATWNPLDTRDGTNIDVAKAMPDNGPHSLEQQSIAIQKRVEAIDPATGAVIPGGQSIRPGSTLLRYTLEFQVSDYYAFDDVFVRDQLSDGQRLFIGTRGAVNAFPTMMVNNAYLTGSPGGSRTTTTGAFAGPQVIEYQRRHTSGNVDSDPTSFPANGPALGAISPGVFLNQTAAPNTNSTTGGNSLLQFNVSQELIARLGTTAGRLVGGEISNAGVGPENNSIAGKQFGGTTGTIVFYAEVVREFSDAFPSGDESVDQGDVLNNSVNDPTTPERDGIFGNQLRPADINAATPTEIGVGSDDSGTSIAIPYGLQEKQIYAINGQTVPPAGPTDPPLSLQPGDRVTYRLTYTLPISSFEQLRMIDFPPLPVMDVDDSGPFTFVRDPAAYTFQPGQVGVLDAAGNNATDDTYFEMFAPGNGAGRNPTVTPDSTTNSVTLNFGSHDDTQRRSTQISVLITFVVGDQPFATDLFLTNQLRIAEGSTNAGVTTVEDLRRFELVRPFVTVQKGTAAGRNTGFTVGSGADQVVFGGTNVALPGMGSNVASTVVNRAGTVLSNTNAIFNATQSTNVGGLNITPSNRPVDAGDTIRYAVVVQNTGKGDAFDVQITDTIQPQYDRAAFVPANNLRVIRGDGTVLTAGTDYTITYSSGTGTFSIELIDAYSAGNIGGDDEDNRLGGLSRGNRTAGAITNGSNTVIVLYDVVLLNTTRPNFLITNTAVIPVYANTEGGDDLTDPAVVPGATEPTDQATVRTRLPLVAKTLISTEFTAPGNNAANQATIGEYVTYEVTLTVPEGFTPAGELIDTLDAGLAFVDVLTFSSSSGLSFANGGLPTAGANPDNTAIENGARTITFDLGDITNSNTDDAVTESITIRYRVIVLNVNTGTGPANNQAGQTRTNSARFEWTSNTTTLTSVPAGQMNTNGGAVTGTATPITLVEPTVTPVKDVANVTAGGTFGQTTRGDAGDEIDYRIVLTAGGTTAYEVSLSDPLPLSFFTGGFAIQSATSTGTIRFNGTARTATPADFTIDGGGNLTFLAGLDVDMDPGATITVVVRGTDFTGSTGQLVTNVAETRWSSLDGTPGTRSTHNANSTERTGADGLLNSGALNDYRQTNDAVIESPPVVRKTIIATSEDYTSPTTINPPGVTTGVNTAIGEVVRFRVYVSIGETPVGTPTANVQVRDFLPTGLSFLNDGTARYAFISSNGTNLSSSSLGTVGISGNETTLATLASASISGVFGDADLSTSLASELNEATIYADGQDVFFRFGDLSNADRDNNVEYLVIEYNVLVRNQTSNQAGTNLDNYVTPVVNAAYINIVNDANGDGLGTGEPTIIVNPVVPTNLPSARVTVVEPNVQINKEVINTTGSVVTYRLTVTNPNTGNTTTAFSTRILDMLNATNFSLNTGSVNVVLTGATGSTDNTTTNLVDVLIDTLPVGGSVVITYTVNVLVTPTGVTTLDNTGKATTTGLMGTQATLPFFGTTAATTGLSGTATGERTGADGVGGLNDYAVQDTERLGSLGDRVYFDADADGVQDGGEAGIVGVPVTVRWAGVDGVFNTGDDSVITVNTGTDGKWTVNALPLGANQKYRVSVPTTIGGMSVTDVRNNGGAANANPDGLGVGVSAITLTGVDAGTTNNIIQDFGYRGTATLGNRVYIDADGDGVQAANGLEPSLPGVTVNLTWAGLDGILGNADDLTFTTVSTAAAGVSPNYLFSNLPAGEFQVAVSTAGGIGGVPGNATLTDSLDDGSLSASGTVTTNLTTGENEITIDFGYKGTASIGDYVWYDIDADGVQDANEPPIVGTTVTLLWSGPNGTLGDADDVTFTTTTDSNGLYLFPSLPVNGASDPYRVTVAAPVAYPTQTFDSDGLGTVNKSTLNLGPTEDNRALDFGYRGTAKLGDFVWLDKNGNGRQDGGEPGLDGVTVQLLFDRDGDGLFTSAGEATPLLTTVTAAGGAYAFPNLAAGKYQVVFGNSDGSVTYTRTVVDSTVASDTTDSDANVSTGATGTYTLANGDNNTTVDAGLYVPISLGNRVFFDFDADGNQDAGEPGIAGVPISVTWHGPDGAFGGGDDKVFNTTTGADGIWTVTNLPPGSFTVEAQPAAATGFTKLTDSIDNLAAAATNPIVVSTTSGVDRTDVDFGFRGTASLGDYVYLDADGDGVQDTNGLEPGLPGVTVTLRFDADNNGSFTDATDGLFTTVTGANGKYLFANLPVGDYQIAVATAGGTGGVPDNTTLTDSLNDGTLTATGTVTTNLVLGETETTIDFGYKGLASIGDFVWYDADGDGVQDANEPGIKGATVTLLWSGPNGTLGDADDVTFTTTTDSNGLYLFPSLPVNGASDPYRVTVAAPAAYPTQTFDSDGLGSANKSTLNLGPTEDNRAQDFGYRGTAKLGDFVWLDKNGNGKQDGGEPGVDGVTVQLLFDRDGDGLFTSAGEATPLLTTVTAAGGAYAFPNLAAGKYQVVFGNSNGSVTYTRTVVDSAVASDTTDSDANVSTGATGTYTLANGDNNASVDAGLYVPISIGDTVWYDANNNGTFDAATEPGIPNAKVTVVWFGPDGVAGGGDDKSFTAFTDSDGKYLVTSLPPGEYTVSVDPTTLAEGLVQTFDLNGVGTPHTTTLTAVSGTNRLDADFGYRGTGSVGDTVFLDINNNGQYDTGEGIAGVQVQISGDVDGDGSPESFTATTDTDGKYTFPNLRVTDDGVEYTVTVTTATLPAGVVQSIDPDATRDGVSTVTISSGVPDDDLQDFGYRSTGTIGDTVFLDVNGNGLPDTGEGLTGITVTITSDFDGDGLLETQTTTTDANGKYLFTGLVTNDGKGGGVEYTVAVVAGTLPADVSQSVDPDGVLSNDSKVTLTDAAGVNLLQDFGYVGTASVGDTVWYDADNDGVKDANEPGLSGAKVNLVWFGQDGIEGNDDDVTSSTFTGANGLWTVTNLPVGQYRASVDVTTLPNDLNVQTFDLDGLFSGNTALFALALNENRTDVDFGYRGTAKLGDYVWVDLNGDGVQDANEPGIPNATVNLTWYGQDGVLGGGDDATLTTVTDANGKYQFTDLPNGTFQVNVDRLTIPANLLPTFDLDGTTTANVALVSLVTGESNQTVDFGYKGTASVGDFVWYDVNNDGTPTFAEPGIAGVTVTLVFGGADGDLSTTNDNITFVTTTDGNGKYLLDGLPVSVAGRGNPLPNYTATVTNVPAIYTAQTFDLDGTPTANTATFLLDLNENRRDVDFGFRGTALLGDFVFEDLNGNGVQDAAEPGIDGVTVNLLDAAGNKLATTNSAGGGTYNFPGLAAGNYKVEFVSPAKYAITAKDQKTNDAADSDADPSTGITATVALATAETNATLDAGLYVPLSIGDTVYFDANGDGTQAGTGEPGIPGATVTLKYAGPDGLFGTKDDTTASATTDANGKYLFPNLAPGNYRVDVSNIPNGLTVPTADLDGTATPNTTKLTATSGADRLDADFGYRGLGSLGDLVFFDFNGDGVQNKIEPGIAGAKVTVTWLGFDGVAGGIDDVVYTTTTDAKGNYSIGDLPLGKFVATVDPTTLPPGFVPISDLDGIATPHTTNVTLGAINPNRLDADFGYRGTGSLGDRVWEDFDADGQQDADEPGVPGATVVVNFAGVDGVFGTVDDGLFTATTGANGVYNFPNLPAGSYKVSVTAGLPAGTQPTYDLDGTPDLRTAASLTQGQNRTDVDFGVRGTSSVSGSVFRDDSNEGLRGPNEPGYAGVTVTLTGTDVLGNSITRVTTTDANGDYTFGGLLPGTYTVTETTQPPNTADGLDSAGTVNGNPVGTAGNDVITGIVLASGEASINNDFGELGPFVAGTVFVDLDRDGKLDLGETPLPGETIQLIDSKGAVIRTTTTGPDGTYLIRGFPPGSYTVRELQPIGYGSSSPNDQLVNVPPLGLTGIDFAEVTGGISGFVYRDFSVDGVRGNAPGETGIGGTPVTLVGTDVRGNAINRTLTTNTDGSYSFDGLLEGDYRVLETQPTGFYYDGLETPGSLGGTTPTNDELNLTLTPGTFATEYNFGELLPADPFGFVYVDANRNGVKDPGELGIAGVPIRISGTAFAGTVLARPLTDADLPGGMTVFTNSLGRWEFPIMPPGLYSVVEVTQPAGFIDGLEHNADPNGLPPTVGNDRFDNIILMPQPIRGPFNFGEYVIDPTKRDFLGTTPPPGVPGGNRSDVPMSPAFTVTTGDPTTPAFVVTANGAGADPLVRVFDFATGGERLRFMAYETEFTGGVRVATGDVDGDGTPDIVTGIGVGGGPRIRAFSGIDGHEIYNAFVYEPTFTGGLFVAIGDVNGDGRNDLVTGTDFGGGPRVRVIDFQTGATISDFFAFDSAQRGGVRVAVADFDGDGKADILATAGAGVETSLRIFSAGNPNAIIREIVPYAQSFTGGVFVAAGDVNGDGTPDIVSCADAGGGPHVQVFDGKTGNAIRSFFAYEPTFSGGVRVSTQDVNGDGRADIVTAPGVTGAARVRIFSGTNLSTLDDFYASDPEFFGGVFVG